MIIINALKLFLQMVFIIQFLCLTELTCFERAWHSTHKHGFAWIKWHGSIQHKVSIRESPRSNLYRFIFYCRWGDTQVELVIILNARINQLLHWALILKCIQQAPISVQVRKILKPRFNVLLDFKLSSKETDTSLKPLNHTAQMVQVTQIFTFFQFNPPYASTKSS